MSTTQPAPGRDDNGRRLPEWIAAGIVLVAVGLPAALENDDLAWELHLRLSNEVTISGEPATNTSSSFATSSRLLYDTIDNLPNNTVRCVYSGTIVNLTMRSGRLHPQAGTGVQVEHTWACKAEWVNPSDHFSRTSSVQGADLHNLFPVRQGINGSRGSHPFADLPDTSRHLRVRPNGSLGRSATDGVDSGSLRSVSGTPAEFEPRDDHKGNVARAMFYMSVRYWMPIPQRMEDALKEWHTQDPVDAAERARNLVIAGIQHNTNPFIDDPRLVAEIDDFD